MPRTVAGGGRASDHYFSEIPGAQIPRSVFNRSHGLKTTFDAAWLIPIFWDEALPGDTLNLKATLFVRMSTPVFPLMDNMYLDTFFFAVPNRLLWDNWQKFCGEQDDPGDSTDFVIPQMTAHTVAESSLSDYLGIPTGIANTQYNTLHHRAYNLIFNEWFRSEDLQDSAVVDTDNGPDADADYVLRRRGKRHDYFTSCLPFTQKSELVNAATIVAAVPAGGLANLRFEQSTSTASGFVSVGAGSSPQNLQYTFTGGPTTAAALQVEDPVPIGVEINTLREAIQIQRLYERDARGGTRYTEIVRSHFGVVSPDARLQRPEFLGGSSQRINVNPVAVTAEVPPKVVGNLAAFITGTNQSGFMRSFSEHCVIIGLANVRADLTYQQGMDKMFQRQSRFDFYWPALAHLGEQAVTQGEIYWDTAGNDTVFGYQERFAEYRYKQSRITATMRSNAATPLDTWHLGLDFASAPLLNDVFIEDDPPMDRVVRVPSEHHFRCDAWFDYRCARPMPTYSVPGLMDHF